MDYVNPGGDNEIEKWLHDLPMEARVAINTRIQYLQSVETLARPYTGKLKGNCKGLIEIRVKSNKVAYRPLAYFGPREKQITILVGAIEKGGAFEPKAACKIALNRKKLIGAAGGIREHSFEEP